MIVETSDRRTLLLFGSTAVAVGGYLYFRGSPRAQGAALALGAAGLGVWGISQYVTKQLHEGLEPPSPGPEPGPSPIPVPQKHEHLIFQNLPIGSLVLVKAGAGIPGQPDIEAGTLTVIEKHLPSPELGVQPPWRYTGKKPNAGIFTKNVQFDERDIVRVISRPPSPV
jgi:hypothetical protein